jgi:hypothetical protein
MPEDWPAAAAPAAPRTDTHDCPGGCGRAVPPEHLACQSCWYRLPRPLRTSVTTAYQMHGPLTPQHRSALRVAFRWYSDHPITLRRNTP